MKKSAFKLFTILTLSAFCIQFQACKDDVKTVKPIVIEFKKEGELTLKTANDSIIKNLDIEIADDEYQTQTGLMYRDSIKQNQGMLFIFPEADYHAFYMKNTQFSLDIIYIDADKNIVSFQNNAQPYSETSLPSNVPAKYVLEINGGLADQWELKVGDKIEYKRID